MVTVGTIRFVGDLCVDVVMEEGEIYRCSALYVLHINQIRNIEHGCFRYKEKYS